VPSTCRTVDGMENKPWTTPEGYKPPSLGDLFKYVRLLHSMRVFHAVLHCATARGATFSDLLSDWSPRFAWLKRREALTCASLTSVWHEILHRSWLRDPTARRMMPISATGPRQDTSLRVSDANAAQANKKLPYAQSGAAAALLIGAVGVYLAATRKVENSSKKGAPSSSSP
jgi:hypothetical protein